jgi:hypothetical protein
MQHFIQTGKKRVVTAVYSLSRSNILTKVSAQGISYPLLESINWEKVEICNEETFKFMSDAFLDSLKTVEKAAPKRFKPNTSYKIYVAGKVILTGYSDKNRTELSLFLLQNKGRLFRVVDEQGITKAILNGDITEVASYALFDI